MPADAAAVALTVTLTESPGPGYFTVAPAGTAQAPTSTVNADGRGQTRAAGAIVGVTGAGLDVYSYAGGHVIVDITGWFTSATAPVASDGLFVPEPAPRRLIDTRNGDPIWAGGGVEIGNVAPERGGAGAQRRHRQLGRPGLPHRPSGTSAAPGDEHRQRHLEQ